MQNSEREFVGECCVNLSCELNQDDEAHGDAQLIDTVANVLHYAARLKIDPVLVVHCAMTHLAVERG